jgi:hypothetical protein
MVAAGYEFAVVGARDRRLPELLRPPLEDRLGDALHNDRVDAAVDTAERLMMRLVE